MEVLYQLSYVGKAWDRSRFPGPARWDLAHTDGLYGTLIEVLAVNGAPAGHCAITPETLGFIESPVGQLE